MPTFDLLPCPVLVTDRWGVVLDLNQSLRDLVGGNKSRWVGQPMEPLFPVASRIFLQSHIWPMLLREGRVREIKLQVLGHGGDRLPVYLNCQQSLLDGVERFTWAFFVTIDRSLYEQELLEARQRAETVSAALAQSEQFVRTVADAMPSLIAYWDTQLRCQFANQPHLAWWGRTPQGMRGLALEALLGPQVFAQQLPHVEGVLGGVAQAFELALPRPDGGIRHTRISYITDRDANAKPRGFFAFMEDISGLKEANERLERRVLERTSELAVQAELASQANLAKSEFLANMSHEMRTPLSAISGMAKLIAREPLSEAQQEQMGKLESAVRHLRLTINDILDLAKIEANALVLEQAPVDVAALVASVGNMAQGSGHAQHIALQVAVDAVPGTLVGDATRIGQALLNYLGNAFKFTEQGSVHLRVAVQQETAQAVWLRFEVQDTGIGIAPQHLGRLFEPFVQADTTTTRQYGGTGLGLAITKRLVQAMDGEVGVQSALGQGSTFWFTVRLAKMTATDVAEPAAPAIDAAAELRRSYSGYAVLLAEDDAFNREIATILLQDAGLQVDEAHDGLEALHMASRKPYALILMDMQMPRMDGVEATRTIRRTAQCSAVPIIALTANAFADDRARCLDAGMNDFLAKPVDPPALYQAILRQFSPR